MHPSAANPWAGGITVSSRWPGEMEVTQGGMGMRQRDFHCRMGGRGAPSSSWWSADLEEERTAELKEERVKK